MKETRYFYVPQAPDVNELPADEATHALRVLRLKTGDEIFLANGKGKFFRAIVTRADKHCCYDICEEIVQEKTWNSHLHLAIAPTKMMERIEWLAEKATEIGFDELSFLKCKFSERKSLRVDRIEKIVVSAMKQSHKSYVPIVNDQYSFSDFIKAHNTGHRYIAHCYEEVPRTDLYKELVSINDDQPVVVMIGPEGDFSIDEVKEAVSQGFMSITLGNSRLRTETAGLYSVMQMQLVKRK